MSPPSISTFIGNQQYLNSRQGSLTANQTLIPNSTSTRGSFSGVASLGYGLHRSSGDSRQSQFQSEGQQTESETVFNHAHSSAVMNTRILQLPELMSVVPSLERVNHSLVSSISASTTALEKEDAWRSSVNEFQTQSRSGSQTKLAYIPDILSASTASYLRKFTHSPSASRYSGNLSGSPSTMDKRSILTMNGNGNASSANAIRSSVLSIRNDGEMSDEEDEDMSRTLQALALEFGNVSRPT
ncbi:hypothetical protein BSLG_005774 [Batrachochytrium salamandrivorans]|nr:hypothetical protein BSLG_005774 [Batrachochytrium salamandrivorans]